MEIQRFRPLNINADKPHSQAKSARKPATSGDENKRPSQTEKEQSPRTEALMSAFSKVADSNKINLSNYHLYFSLDEDTGETVISVIDNKTGEIVRQIPPDEILQLKKKMEEIHGLLLDRKV